MLWVFLILALATIAFIAILVIALVLSRRAGLVNRDTFEQYSHIATIVGLPLAVIGAVAAIVTTAALLFRDSELPPAHPSPSPAVEIAKTSPRPDLPTPATPLPNQTSIALVTPTPSPLLPGTPERRAEESPLPRTSSEDQASSTQPRYDRGDVGKRKENGYYEITLDNAKTEPTCRNGFARVSNQEKLITITFSLRAAHLQVPSIPTGQDVNTYYVEDADGRRYQMSCGDGRYFNVSLNSFEGKPKPKSLGVSFVVPISAQDLRFRFSPPAGDAIVLNLPNPL